MFQTSVSGWLRLPASKEEAYTDLKGDGEGKQNARWYNFLRFRKRYCTFG